MSERSVYTLIEPIGDGFLLASGTTLYIISTTGTLLSSHTLQSKIRALTTSKKYISVAGDDKQLFLFTHQWDLVFQTSTIKKVNKIVLDGDDILACDKFGDVYRYTNGNARLLLGHVSICTDMLLTRMKGNQVLITSDRDEKIRISGYPDTFNIHQFLLGHTEFVSRVCQVGDLLVSGGGDDFIGIWKDGQLVQQLDLAEHIKDGELIPLPQEGKVNEAKLRKVAVVELRAHKNHVAVVVERLSKVFVLEVKEKAVIKEIVDLKSDALGCAFSKDGSLFILQNNEETPIVVHKDRVTPLPVLIPPKFTYTNFYETSSMRKWSSWVPEFVPGPVDEEALHAKKKQKTKRGGQKQKKKKELVEEEGGNLVGESKE